MESRADMWKSIALIICALLMMMLLACGGGGGGDAVAPPTPAPPPAAEPLTTEAGIPMGVPVSTTIGPAGGTLSSSDGRVQITVPAGAVAADTVFTITPLTNPADNAMATFKLEPDGMTFTSPLTLTFSAPEAGVSRTAIEGLGIAYHNADNHWQWLTGVTIDTDAKTLSVPIEHFSVYSMLSGYIVTPASASVDVNNTVALQIMYCRSTQPDDSDLASLVFECHAATPSEALVTDWSVNGTAGGNATFGTIAGSGPNATFTAPAQTPDPSTVQVTAEVTDVLGSLTAPSGKVMVFSLITIGQTASYQGDFTVSTQGMGVVNWTGTGTASWTPSNSYGEYTVSSTITPDQTEFVIGDAVCTLNGATQTYENIGEIKAWSEPATAYWVLNVSWSATCVSDEGVLNYPNFIRILWASGCVADWAPLDASFPDHNSGSYTWAGCNPLYPNSATVTWDFVKQD